MAKKKALVVGINEYPAPNRLPSCVNDANAFKAMLGSVYGYSDITTLLDAQATPANFTAAIQKMLAGAANDDRYVIYFSGHGYSYAPDNVVKEFIVLYDQAFFSGSDLAALTQQLPPGVLTVVLDSCFSGGMNRPFFVTTAGERGVEVALCKSWTPLSDDQIDKSFQKPIVAYEPFGCEPIDIQPFPGTVGTKLFIVRSIVDAPNADKRLAILAKGQVPPATFDAPARKNGYVAPVARKSGSQLLLNGLLVAACRTDETAAASNSLTGGLSAFTSCLRQEIFAGGAQDSSAVLVDDIASRLQTLGFQQTPVLKDPPTPEGMDQLTFVNLDSASDLQKRCLPAGSRRLDDFVAELSKNAGFKVARDLAPHKTASLTTGVSQSDSVDYDAAQLATVLVNAVRAAGFQLPQTDQFPLTTL